MHKVHGGTGEVVWRGGVGSGEVVLDVRNMYTRSITHYYEAYPDPEITYTFLRSIDWYLNRF